jgi:sRNA-binding regulator protein Hfq
MNTPATSPAPEALLQLAQARFAPLRDAERTLLAAAPLGETAWCGPSSKDFDPGNNPAKADGWGPERSIRAGLIRWLCIDREARDYVDPLGIHAHGARIEGSLDLSFVSVHFPLALRCCSLKEETKLRFLHIPTVSFAGSSVRSINAERAKVAGTMSLSNGFSCEGEVQLLGARIGSNLDCGAGRFRNPAGKALRADRIRIHGSLFLRNGFAAEGEVRLLGAEIGGNFECNDGSFANPSGSAISGDRMNVQGSVFLRDGFSAEGEVRLLGAQVSGNLECNGGKFKNPGGCALVADRVNVKGNVLLLNGFVAEGGVDLPGAQIGNNLSCDGGVFRNPRATALNADSVNVRGFVGMRGGFSADGEVNLLSAQIGDNFECDGGSFKNAAGKALNADRVGVQGDVLLRDGFSAEGEVSFANSITKGTLVWTGVRNAERVSLNLSNAAAGAISDDKSCWPAVGKLNLDGFVYEHIASGLTDTKNRLAWLALQQPFTPQPYRQLAKVMRNAGVDRGARRVLFALEDHLWREEDTFSSALLRGPLSLVVGYGYYPLRALAGLVILVLVGWGIFAAARSARAMVPTDEKAYELFKTTGATPAHYQPLGPLVYSLENSLPLVKLGQTDRWQPDPTPGADAAHAASDPPRTSALMSRLLFAFQRLQVLLGWILATLFVAGVTGIVQKD